MLVTLGRTQFGSLEALVAHVYAYFKHGSRFLCTSDGHIVKIDTVVGDYNTNGGSPTLYLREPQPSARIWCVRSCWVAEPRHAVFDNYGYMCLGSSDEEPKSFHISQFFSDTLALLSPLDCYEPPVDLMIPQDPTQLLTCEDESVAQILVELAQEQEEAESTFTDDDSSMSPEEADDWVMGMLLCD